MDLNLLFFFCGAVTIGLFINWISKKSNMPHTFLILLSGLATGAFYGFDINISLIHKVGLLTLSILIFRESLELNPKKFDTVSKRALLIFMLIFLLNLVFNTLSSALIFGIQSFLVLASFIALLVEQDYEFTHRLKNTKKSTISFLRKESAITNTLSSAIAFTFFYIYDLLNTRSLSVADFTAEITKQITLELGLGIIAALIAYRFFRKTKNFDLLSLMTVLIIFIITFYFTQKAFFSALILGLALSNLPFKYKKEKKSTHYISKILSIFSIFLLGFIMPTTIEQEIIIYSIIIFSIYLFIRAISISIYLRKKTNLEKLILTLSCSKGPILASLLLILYGTEHFMPFSEIFFMIMLFSFMTTFAATKLSKRLD